MPRALLPLACVMCCTMLLSSCAGRKPRATERIEHGKELPATRPAGAVASGPGGETHGDARGAERDAIAAMEGRVYEILLVTPGQDDRADRLAFRDGRLASWQFRRLGYAPGEILVTLEREGWTLTSTSRAASGAEAFWQANVQEDGIEGTLEWRRADGTRTTLAWTGALLPPLYERLGGGSIVPLIAADFVSRAAADPLTGVDPGLANEGAGRAEAVRRIVALLAGVGGKDAPRSAPLPQATSEATWNPFAADLRQVLAKHRVDEVEQEELMELLTGRRDDVVRDLRGLTESGLR